MAWCNVVAYLSPTPTLILIRFLSHSHSPAHVWNIVNTSLARLNNFVFRTCCVWIFIVGQSDDFGNGIVEKIIALVLLGVV